MSNRDKEDIIKSKEDFKPGDDDCTSCSGIALFASKDARWTKDSNWCIGVRRSVKAKIILPTHQPDTESFGTEQKKVILIGNSKPTSF